MEGRKNSGPKELEKEIKEQWVAEWRAGDEEKSWGPRELQRGTTRSQSKKKKTQQKTRHKAGKVNFSPGLMERCSIAPMHSFMLWLSCASLWFQVLNHTNPNQTLQAYSNTRAVILADSRQALCFERWSSVTRRSQGQTPLNIARDYERPWAR